MPYHIYNHTSEDMRETADTSVDLILAGPPYNIGTTYSTNRDASDTGSFESMLDRIIGECARVLKTDGKLVVECADTVFRDGTYTCLSALIAKQASGKGLVLVERHVSYTHTNHGLETPADSHWTNSFTTREGAHSNCHQIMVFQKGSGTFAPTAGQILYYQLA